MSIDLDDGDCIHGVWPATSCSICSGHDAADRKVAERAPVTFTAAYESACPSCRQPIRVGDTIAWKEGTRAFHEGCWPT